MIRYDVVGEGPELVLVHGVGLDRGMWHRCVPRLSRRFRVVVPDLRGHGESPAAAEGTTLTDLAADVAEVVGDGAHVVGFSLGALVAQRLALDCPRQVASLTLVSSVAHRTPAQATAALDRLRAARADFPGVVDAAVDRWFRPSWQTAEPGLVASVRATMLANDVDSYLACYRVFATGDAELWPALPAVTCPVLAVTGADDPMSTPAMSRALAARVRDGVAAVVPDARHLLPLERPDALVAEIEGFVGTEVR